MLKVKDRDLTQAPLRSSIILYTIPIIFASLIQVLFNAVDLAVLGWFDKTPGSSQIGAIGATGSIISLLVNSVIGLSGGANIPLARSIGAKDNERSQRIVSTALIIAFFGGIIMMGVGLLSANWFLEITKCPSNCFGGALTYLNIYFIAVPAIFIYNFGSAIIRVSGDSQRPLYYMIIAGLLNVILNVILCFILENKVAAVAIATLASQVLGAVLVLIHLARIEGPCHLDIKKMVFSTSEFKTIFAIGLPLAFNTGLYSISNLQIQGALNSFGSSAIAGNAASAQIEGITSSFMNSFGVTTLTFAGQNIGANNPERVKKSIGFTALLSVSVTLVLSALTLLFRKPLLSLFLPADELAVRFAIVRMFCLFTIFWIMALNSVLNSAIQSFGYSSLPMINSIVTVLILRVIWMSFIYPALPITDDPVRNIFNLYVCYTISWTLSFIAATTMFCVIYRRYKNGKIKAL